MSRSVARLAVIWVLALGLLVGCQPRPGPEGTARAYVDAWDRGDYAALYALADGATHARLDATAFTARYQEAAAAAELRAVSAALGQRSDVDDDHARFALSARWDTARVGTFTQELSLPLVYEDQRWAVQWQPGLLLAGLGETDHVRYVPEPGARGAIVDRGGHVLAAAGLDRTYPDGALAAHVLGYVRPQSDPPPPAPATPDAPHAGADPSAPDSSLSTHHSALGGAAGLERWGDRYLTGTAGGRLVIVDAHGGERGIVAEQPPRTGATLELTLDAALQRRAEALLEGKVGAVVALDARDGAVLALASRPTFEPRALSEAPAGESPPGGPAAAALRDRATEGTYPVASLFKVVVMAAGLENGDYDPASSFRCTGAWTGLGGGLALEDSLATGHGQITLADGLVQSCNTVFYEIGKRLNGLDPHLLPAVARAFGLGAPTGLVGLDEAPGAVPDPRTREAQGETWTPREAVEVAIGHGGLEATPLQLARLYAALATDGKLRAPVLVRQVVVADGRVVYAGHGEIQGALPLSEPHQAAIQQAMRGVVADPRGTAAAAFRGFAIPVAGKTGSAESDDWRLHAWFAGYAPADAPEIVVVALVEHGGGGGQTAAPIVRGVLEEYFAGRER